MTNFLYIFWYFEKDNVNVDSIKLINDFEMSALKTKRIKSQIFNFIYFEKTFKMPKQHKYIEYILFLDFLLFFYFWICFFFK